MKYKIIVILGTTATGKSSLAVKVAKKFNGEVISADSRQVYKGLNIGTGKITKKDMKGVPHHMLDVVSPKKVFSVSLFQKKTEKIIADIISRNKIPIICGGTGFYIQSIVEGVTLPKVPPNKALRKKLEKNTPQELFKILQKLDPRRAKNIDKKNMNELEQIKRDVEEIKKRNIRVEENKAWEVSYFRKTLVTILTYIVIVLFFFFARLPNPFINALVPTLVSVLSAFSVSYFKKIWIRNKK